MYSSGSCGSVECCTMDEAMDQYAEINDELGALKKYLARELVRAAEEGSLKVVKAILNSEVELNRRKFWGPNLPSFLRAWSNGHHDCVKAICSSGFGFYPEFENETPRDVLMKAAVDYDDVDCLKALMRGGESYGQCNGRLALLEAITRNKVGLLRMLLEAGIGRDELSFSEVRSVESAELLIKHGANINAVNTQGGSALTNAVRCGDFKLSEFLLEHGAKTNPPGCTHQVLCLAIQRRFEYVRGAYLRARARSGDAKVKAASVDPNLQMLGLLLKHGADANAKNSHGYTALHNIASQSYDCAVEAVGAYVRLLVEHKANPNALNDHGKTPLDKAIGTNCPELVRILLQNGATRTGGKPAIQIARERKDATAAVILAHFAKVKST